MRVWILLALAMCAVVAYPQQNQDVAVAHQVSPMDSGMNDLRRLKGKTAAHALKPLTFSGRTAAKVKQIFRGKKENPKVFNFKEEAKGRYGPFKKVGGTVSRYDTQTGGELHFAGGFKEGYRPDNRPKSG